MSETETSFDAADNGMKPDAKTKNKGGRLMSKVTQFRHKTPRHPSGLHRPPCTPGFER
jgi:hypothetical protein